MSNNIIKRGVIVLLLTLPFLLLTSFTAATETENGYITGTVISSTDNTPLAGTTIIVVGTTLHTSTDSKGEFKLRFRGELPATLQFSFMGYYTQEVVVESLNEPINITLEESQQIVDAVVVTGTRSPKPLKEVPVLTRVVSSEDIERINPMDIQSLLEYEVPGLQFSRAHGSNLPSITFQGMEGPYVLFLINGERVAGEGSSGNIDFSRFNVDDVERVEIVRGAMSTLYGSSAMGGVINIITKDANRPLIASVNGRVDSEGGHKESISLGGNFGSFSTLTSGTYRTEQPYLVTDKDGYNASTTGYSIIDISQKFGYTVNEKLQLNLDGSFYQNDQIDLVESKVSDRFSSLAINPRLRWLITENSTLNASYVYDNYSKDEVYQSASVADNRIYDDIKHTLRADYVGVYGGKHTLTAGLEVEFEDLLHYRMQDSSNVATQNYVAFLQDDWRITENFSLVGGIRADIHSDYGVCPSPKISMMYKTGNWAFRGGYAMGFRFPSLLERYEEYDMGGLGMFIIYGNPDLKVEKSHQFSLSGEFTKGGFNASLSGYYNRFFDKISLMALNDGTSDMCYFNAEDGTTAGADLTLQQRFSFGLTLKGSYSYVNCYELLDGYNVSSVRPHSSTFSAQYSLKLGSVQTSLAFNGRWSSSVNTWSQNSTTLEWEPTTYNSRTICSLNLGITPYKGISVGLLADNLFDFQDASIGSDTTLTVERGFTFVATLGINIAQLFNW